MMLRPIISVMLRSLVVTFLLSQASFYSAEEAITTATFQHLQERRPNCWTCGTYRAMDDQDFDQIFPTCHIHNALMTGGRLMLGGASGSGGLIGYNQLNGDVVGITAKHVLNRHNQGWNFEIGAIEVAGNPDRNVARNFGNFVVTHVRVHPDKDICLFYGNFNNPQNINFIFPQFYDAATLRNIAHNADFSLFHYPYGVPRQRIGEGRIAVPWLGRVFPSACCFKGVYALDTLGGSSGGILCERAGGGVGIGNILGVHVGSALISSCKNVIYNTEFLPVSDENQCVLVSTEDINTMNSQQQILMR